MSSPATLSTTTHALKEWAVAVDALERGKTILLLRKGGIHERGGRFTVPYHQVLLYPTYEHQQPHLLKPDYAATIEPVPSGWHPTAVRIGAWADITHVFQVKQAETIAALLPYHIWQPEFVVERFNWKPDSPLSVLLLRVYTLQQPQLIPYRSSYGGCKSWIDLAEAVTIANATPALDETRYTQQTTQIAQILQ